MTKAFEWLAVAAVACIAFLLLINLAATSTAASVIKDCAAMGQSRMGDKAITCAVKPPPQ